jgi:hypothetical protein
MSTLQEAYPIEWEEITLKKVPKKEIDEYLLKFVAKLLREVREGKREEIDLGDGFAIGKFAMGEESSYKLSPELEEFLIKLGNYKVEFPNGKEVWTDLNSIKEVETELKKIARKLDIEF